MMLACRTTRTPDRRRWWIRPISSPMIAPVRCTNGPVGCLRFNPIFLSPGQGVVLVALTQVQLAAAVADRSGLSKADAKRALAALEHVALDHLGNAHKVRIGGLVQLTVRVKPATNKRQGRNPPTGEHTTIAAKPASVHLRAQPPAAAKGSLPSLQKPRRPLAATS